jgi:hypothetical protein
MEGFDADTVVIGVQSGKTVSFKHRMTRASRDDRDSSESLCVEPGQGADFEVEESTPPGSTSKLSESEARFLIESLQRIFTPIVEMLEKTQRKPDKR